MKKIYRCFALFSGGLDSILAILHMKKLQYDVIPIFFKTPFFGPEKALEAAEKANFKLRIVDITKEHLEMIKNPRYGFGKNMNPCIDCHGLMFRKAGEMMMSEEVDFLISGEVLGQRPMSQRFDALNSVGKLSQVKDLLVRPLCQKLLADTLPIREGWVKKEEMLDIQGRGRHRQIQMAKDLGISSYQTPGGGCLLTDQGFSRRLRDLMEHDNFTENNINLLRFGRHFRLNDTTKFIVGKNDKDNDMIGKFAEQELVFQTVKYPGPLGILISTKEVDKKEIEQAASILLRYNNKAAEKDIVEYGLNFKLNDEIVVEKMSNNEVVKLMI